MKRAFALLLALVLVLSLVPTAFAATTDVTISDMGTVTRTIDAYQIMTATNAGSSYSYQVNPKYKDILIDVLGVTDAELEGKSDVEASDVIEAKIKALATGVDSQQRTREFADDVYHAILDANRPNVIIPADKTLDTAATVSLEEGYWLFADVTNLANAEYGNSLVMLDTAGETNLTIDIKPRRTTTDKVVDDENDSALDSSLFDGEDNTDDWRKAADWDVGDDVPYQITVTLPDNIGSYVDKDGNGYFALKIVDKADPGLTYNEDFVLSFPSGRTVNAVAKASATANDLFVYEIDADTNTVTIYPNFGYTKHNGTYCEPSAANGGDMLSLHSSNGTINPLDLSTMTFTVNYTAKVNAYAVPSSTGYVNEEKVIVSNDPYHDSFGETPTQKTTVFNYKLIVDKIDAATQKPLAGADFVLEKFIPCGDNACTNAAHGQHFYLNHTDQVGYFVKSEATESENLNSDGKAITFNFTGLDAGAYRLRETVVPEGYNPIPDMYFLVLSEIGANNELTDLFMKELRYNTGTGGNPYLTGGPGVGSRTLYSAKDEPTMLQAASMNLKVENSSGTELPQTGGAGTTMLYIAGATLVAFAMIMLITKKRMASAE